MNNLRKRVLRDVDVTNKTVVCHLDLNVLIHNHQIVNDKRIRASMATLSYLINHNAKVVVISHLGRINTLEDKTSGKNSLRIVADTLARKLKRLGATVTFSPENTGDNVVALVKELKPKDVLILENTRYCDVNEKGEYVGLEWLASAKLGKFWASLGDIFIEDAFGVAHRLLASNYQTASHSKESAIGFSIINETNHIDLALDLPKRPYLALLGGNRVTDKIDVIEVICQRADNVIIGGGIVFTFLHVQGFDVGLNLVEKEAIEDCKQILNNYGNKITLCFDFLCNNDFSDTRPIYRKIDENLDGLYALDIGKRSLKIIKRAIKHAQTILWNGPFGVIENIKYYAQGTTEIIKAVAKQADKGAYTIISDIDTSNHAEFLGLDKRINFISSGGGASLAYIAESVLHGIDPIEDQPIKRHVYK
ncbi:phosphoglycerate kinase [Ureaplasma diversum]|uniref:Phosphoglycerate kinase n=1 Tax=Ureaplasma diversum NCTC 246 TaxID=1188241 RepID=A0A084F1G4_9BACT|nr:phosphoglycerate kinase [Ureaplasma diversum]KEZ24056.1 Phosphoglycerate kinase [Ureaplasma diversum NCTC 246]